MSFDKNVFINCPFDKDYKNDLLKPMLYILIRNGLNPRLALENSDSGENRLDKIVAIITECQYSIHDLSKVKSDKIDEYARMNMPFELGLDYGIRKMGSNYFTQKKFLILEGKKYDYQKAVSDINGFDCKAHENETKGVFKCIRSWLSETLSIMRQIPPGKIYDDFMDFNTSLYEDKLKEFNNHAYATEAVEVMTIPEYISEIRNKHQSV